MIFKTKMCFVKHIEKANNIKPGIVIYNFNTVNHLQAKEAQNNLASYIQ